MNESFPAILSALRREKGVNQRTAAAALSISQALLSHYENGLREPGLDFIRNACDFYGVTADYLLGNTELKDSSVLKQLTENAQYLSELTELIEKTIKPLFDSLPTAVKTPAAEIIAVTLYKLYRACGADTGAILPDELIPAVCEAKIKMTEARLFDALRDSSINIDMPSELRDFARNSLTVLTHHIRGDLRD